MSKQQRLPHKPARQRVFYSQEEYDAAVRQRAARKRKKRIRIWINRTIALGLLVAIGVLVYFIFQAVEAIFFDPKRDPQNMQAGSTQTQSTPANGQTEPGGADADSGVAAPGAQPVTGPTDRNAWYLVLANANHPLPEGYAPDVTQVDTVGHMVDSRIAEPLMQMMEDGNATGLQLMICSAYRSHERQTTLFNQMQQDYMAQGKTEQEAYDITRTIRSVPGTSEHETGLAVDIVAVNAQVLEDTFENTPEFAWLSEHAADYGFVLRYPKTKQDITGIIYEPWHYRYVGVEDAKRMQAAGLCLEEYLAQ